MSGPRFPVRFLRAPHSTNNSYVGEIGEMTIDSTHWRNRIHNGTQVGGYEFYTSQDVQDMIGARLVSTEEPQASDGVDGDVWLIVD